MDLTTTYLGMTLPHPFIVGASPLTGDLDRVKRLVDAGASAVVMHSLFEEQILDEEARDEREVRAVEESFAEALTYFPRREEYGFDPDGYLKQLARIRATAGVPVIGSFNGVTRGGWLEYAREIEKAGADALELNLYSVPADPDVKGAEIEERYLQVVREVRGALSIPVAVKLSPFFSSLPDFVRRLEGAGVNGVVLFNRFYQPDIDVENLETVPTLTLSDSSELLLRLRWLAILSGRVRISLAVTGGVHTAKDAIKAIMVGAHGILMVSALLKHGPGYLRRVREETERWMELHEYESLEQMRGSMSLLRCPDPSAYERGNYVKILLRKPVIQK